MIVGYPKNMTEAVALQRANAIIDACYGSQQTNASKDIRSDGYQNMLTKYGTSQDSSTAYVFSNEATTDDYTLSINYQFNGLFAKIIDLPAGESVSKGFNLQIEDEDIEKMIQKVFTKLNWEEKFEQAMKWARCFGGALVVMLINDGRGLEEPLNFRMIRDIEELFVYESAIVNPVTVAGSPSSKPEWYQVASIDGTFTVHSSSFCLYSFEIYESFN